MNSKFWKNKTVLITGHTGFKGSWLSLWLQQVEAKVVGYALAPPTNPNLFEKASVASKMTSINGDIRDLKKLKKVFYDYKPDIVIHMAAQALVRYSYDNPIETYETNVMGTLNVLESIRSVKSVRSAIMVTTDKCYLNKEWVWAYRENEAMGGYDPYSSSKGCAELLISSYRNSYFPNQLFSEHKTAVASVRSGNVIGGGDWAEDRLIPDIMHAIHNKKVIDIRNPTAIRPWQHVLEPLSGYMLLAEKLYTQGYEYAQAWNFGPLEQDAKSVQWITEYLVKIWGSQSQWNSSHNTQDPHEATYLKLDCAKAHQHLSWWPKWNIETAIEKIVDWHKAESNSDLREVCIKQINEYQAGNL